MWTSEALQDRLDIWDYIAAEAGNCRSAKVLATMHQSVRQRPKTARASSSAVTYTTG